jgi:hypothetical protein
MYPITMLPTELNEGAATLNVTAPVAPETAIPLPATAEVTPPAGAFHVPSPRKNVLELGVPVAEMSATVTTPSGKPPTDMPVIVPLPLIVIGMFMLLIRTRC